MKIEDLKNTKIYMSNEADVIKFQDKIFNLGIKMADGTTHVSNLSLKDIFFTINNKDFFIDKLFLFFTTYSSIVYFSRL